MPRGWQHAGSEDLFPEKGLGPQLANSSTLSNPWTLDARFGCLIIRVGEATRGIQLRTKRQSLLFRGIYEFEDPTGSLIAAKIPHDGTADLYDGTVVVVRPNQCAIFIYNGKIADVLPAGSHTLKTENLPIITRLAHSKLGFQSPLRCELWFFSGNVFTARRWGTAQPVVGRFESLGPVPIRAYGNYNIVVRDPRKVFHNLIGSRNAFDVSDLEDFVQGQLVELLPEAIATVTRIEDLSVSHDAVSKKLESLMKAELEKFGIQVQKIQVLSLLPPKDVLAALDSRAAMKVIGNQREYLLYKAANSLDALNDGKSNDSMQMMMGLMLGKGLIGLDYHEKEKAHGNPENKQALAVTTSRMACAKCKTPYATGSKFCSQCGGKL
jgi:membrane protease subunit (stomatin/prohibitin family)